MLEKGGVPVATGILPHATLALPVHRARFDNFVWNKIGQPKVARRAATMDGS